MICDGVNNVWKKKKGCRQKDVLNIYLIRKILPLENNVEDSEY